MATREEYEAIDEGYYYDEILGLPHDTDKDGFYPGEREWELANPEKAAAYARASAKAAKEAEQALLEDILPKYSKPKRSRA